MSRQYPVWWDKTVTVYNRYEDPQTQVEHWHRVVVTNCFWKYVGDRVSIGEVVLETNKTICRIPEKENYLPRYKWVSTPNDQMENYFTLGKGDIIIAGEVDDIVDEYSAGHRSTDLISKYKDLQGCMVIDEVAENIGVGRNNPHYYVSGI